MGLLAALLSTRASSTETFSAGRAPFALEVRGKPVQYEVFALFVMPAEVLTIKLAGRAERKLSVFVDGEILSSAAANRWTWRAPSTPGLYLVEARDAEGGESVRLNIFVLVPASEVRDEHLNGYRIGRYPKKPFRNLAAYRPPRGFVEITEENVGTRVSPHFTLGQFLCKQVSESTHYLVLSERLLLKLEHLLQLVNAKGYRAETFAVLSGFRTPYYNAAIGNVPNSRHLWGGAADIFIDESPKDGIMDDLNKDGRIDRKDAELLYRLFETASRSAPLREIPGGLGLYGATPVRGPFVHVDARGYRARWGGS